MAVMAGPPTSARPGSVRAIWRGVGFAVGGLAGGGVGRELGLDRLEQADLGGHLGRQVRERHRRVIGPVQLDGRLRGGGPLRGPRLALVAAGRGADQRGQLGRPGGQQRPRVSVAFQHLQVGLAQVAGQRGHRHQLPHQVLDPGLVPGGLLGEPVAGPHPPVQGRLVPLGQLQLDQPVRGGQRQPRQRLGVDPVALGMPPVELAQVSGLRRGHPVHRVAAGGQEPGHREPGRAGRLQHHLQPGALRRPGQRPGLHRQQRLPRGHAPGRAHLLPRAIEHPHRVLRCDPQIDAGQPPDRHLAGPVHLHIHGHLP